jgi:hypothetical protein
MRILSATCTALALVAACGPAGARAAEELVTANFTAQQDTQGFQWDIQTQGSIKYGTDRCFRTCGYLNVDGNSFNPTQRLMTKDGGEFVLSGTSRNLQITRRVKVDRANAVLRYVEILHNPSKSPISTNLQWVTMLGRAPAMSVVSDNGRPVPASQPFLPAKQETGVLAYGNPGASQLSVLFFLPNDQQQLQWTIGHDSAMQFSVAAAVTVPAGKTVAIVHGIAQRRIKTLPQGTELAKLFKPMRSSAWSRDLPPDVRRSLVNVRPAYSWSGDEELISLESLGLAPRTQDVLAINPQTRLRGTATWTGLTVDAGFGKVQLPVGDVAALVGQRSGQKNCRVFMRDGQVFVGQFDVENLQFTMSTGIGIEVDSRQIEVLLMRRDPFEGPPHPPASAMIALRDGNRIAVRPGAEQTVDCTTPWGDVQLGLGEILNWQSVEDPIGHRIELRDGCRLFAYTTRGSLTVPTETFGDLTLDVHQIGSFRAAASKPESDSNRADDELAAPYVSLAGENRIVGRLDLAELRFETGSEIIPISSQYVRLLRPLGGESGELAGEMKFFAELWDGSTITGTLARTELPIRAGSRVFQVPIRDVEQVRVTVPTIPDSLRQQIAKLIAKLGDADYRQREAATQALTEIGFVARPQLVEAQDKTTDVEVRRRVERLLNEISDSPSDPAQGPLP